MDLNGKSKAAGEIEAMTEEVLDILKRTPVAA
jgi:hypothetical protein